MGFTKSQLDDLIFKTRLGRISLRQCRKAFEIVFRKEMPDRMAYVDALYLATTKAGDDRIVSIVRAIARIDGS